MVNYSAPLYQHKPEVWDAAKCEKVAKHTAKDGLGTPYPFKGYIGCGTSIPPGYGEIRYNGGCVRDGEWYQGEEFPFPQLAPGFKIVKVVNWGWRLIKVA